MCDGNHPALSYGLEWTPPLLWGYLRQGTFLLFGYPQVEGQDILPQPYGRETLGEQSDSQSPENLREIRMLLCYRSRRLDPRLP